MIAEKALQIAGPGAQLVSRPTGVAHVYVGPLTPAGAVSRRHRPVCRTRTRLLRTIPLSERRSSLDPQPARRLCARCSACLSRTSARDRQVGPCIHRDDYVREFSSLTVRDLWAQAVMAETLAELEAVALVSLIVLGHPACQQRFPFTTCPENYPVYARIHAATASHTRNLTEFLGVLRERLAGYPNRAAAERFNEMAAAAYEQARADRREDRKERIRRARGVLAELGPDPGDSA